MTMLTEICADIRNWFVVKNGIHSGQWKIEDGKIVLPFLANEQFFRIKGSVFNDGVYRYDGTLNLHDEEFTGEIWAMAVPSTVIALSHEIEAYCKSEASKPSPYASESFGGYSYTRASNANGQADGSWGTVFASRLNQWRKL